MNFSFKKFLPEILRDDKWGELAEVWQSIYDDLKNDKIRPIFNQYDPDKMSRVEFISLARMFGFDLKTLTGYTETLNFLKKEALFIIPRLKVKTTPLCYILQGIPFNLISTGYSVIYDNNVDKFIGDESLTGDFIYGTTTLDREDRNYTYTGSLINTDGSIELDGIPVSEIDNMYRVSIGTFVQKDPSYLDFVEFPTLDGSDLLYSLTRNFIYNYEHKFVESATEFMSLNTLSVLYNDVKQFKRTTDRVYFEPYLKVHVNSDKSITAKDWTDYNGDVLATQQSILIKDNFENWETIRFGTGAHSTIDVSITDVATYSFEWDYTDNTNKIIETLTNYNFRTLITEMQKITEFTELAVLDTSGDCVLYSTFPKIQFDSTMYCNLKFDFKII
jgi:hypothetical protein